MSPPLNALAINTVHDGVEGLLSLAGDHLRADIKKHADFAQIFDPVMSRLEDSSELIGFRRAMLSMNEARVNFKHHGNVASESTVRRHVDQSLMFAEALTISVFGRRLDSVDLLVFIRSDEARRHLGDSEKKRRLGDLEGAMESLRLGFDALVGDYERRKVWSPMNSLFDTRPSFPPSMSDLSGLGRPFESMLEWIENIDKWVKYLALGVDMRQYAYFQAHTPAITYYAGGRHGVNARASVPLGGKIFERCFKFVVDTALSLAADDFDFDLWAARGARAVSIERPID
jgi:hypothetical protein